MSAVSRTVRVATIQCGAASEDIEENTRINIELLYQTADLKPDFVLFSELSTTPLFTSVHDTRFFEWADAIPGRITEAFSKAASDIGTTVILTMFERTPQNDFYNSAVVIGSDGEIVYGTLPDKKRVPAYRKTHIPSSYDSKTNELRSNEKFYFKPGPGFPIFETPKGRIGILICWDKRYTEAWRILGLLGSEIVFNPMATWGQWRNKTYMMELQMMAMTNQFFVVGCGKAGKENIGYEKNFVGGSFIVNPEGNVVAEGSCGEGVITHADLDLLEVARARVTTPIYRDRRPDLYDILAWQSIG